MLERIFQAIKEFYISHAQHSWLERHLLYFFILGAIAAIILIAIIILKTNREIKKMNKEKRRRDKNLLKFLSDKKNKTW